MSTEPASTTRENPKEARRASGVTGDGQPLYICQQCARHKRNEFFGVNQYGRLNTVCADCERLIAAGAPRRKYLKDRSHITATTKVCKVCEREKSTDEFWLDGKNKDGLKDICGDCTRVQRDYKAAQHPVQYDTFMPASAIQPALDQAIKERDDLERELESLRSLHAELQRDNGAKQPRTDLLLLNAIQRDIISLQQRVDQIVPSIGNGSNPLHGAVTKAASLVGPVAYRIFKWADHHMQQLD